MRYFQWHNFDDVTKMASLFSHLMHQYY